MIRAIVVIGLLTATPVTAAEPLISPELKELATELAVSAYFVGACERYIPKADADDLLRRLTNLDDDPAESLAEEFLVPILLKSYAEGRAESASLGLTSQNCTNLIRKQSADLDRALRKAKAAR